MLPPVTSTYDTWLRAAFILTLPATLLLMLAVARGWTDRIDRRLFARLEYRWPPEGQGKPPKLATAARDLTALGGDMLRTLFIAVCASGLGADGRIGVAGLLIGLYVSARLFVFVFKRIVRRPRPDIGDAAITTYTSSFPSGHSFMTIVAYLSAAILIPIDMPPALIQTFVPLALLAGLAVGMTRISFRVHWPTDVAAGWLAGIAWTSGGILLANALSPIG